MTSPLYVWCFGTNGERNVREQWGTEGWRNGREKGRGEVRKGTPVAISRGGWGTGGWMWMQLFNWGNGVRACIDKTVRGETHPSPMAGLLRRGRTTLSVARLRVKRKRRWSVFGPPGLAVCPDWHALITTYLIFAIVGDTLRQRTSVWTYIPYRRSILTINTIRDVQYIYINDET